MGDKSYRIFIMVVLRKITRLYWIKLIPLLFLITLLYCFGVFSMFFEQSYSLYEAQVDPKIEVFVKQWLNNELPAANFRNSYNYSFIHKCEKKCDIEDSSLRLVYIVKSSTKHFDRREAIRNSWGFEKRFSDVEIRTIFVLGVDEQYEVQQKINEESKLKGDIVQANFKDDYYNNTIKTMISIEWAVKYCNRAKFYFFSDDDMYVSTKNVLRFIRNPLEYPGYLEVPIMSHRNKDNSDDFRTSKRMKDLLDVELRDDTELYAGYVFKNTRPLRSRFSKWYISLSEYPYDSWPPYIPAGAYVLSNRALKKLYYASMYVPHFKFDDIYLSMLALAINMVPLHNSEFYFYKKSYEPYSYRYVIASHGFDDPKELRWIWNDQKSLGNA